MASIVNEIEYDGAGIYLLQGINNPYVYVGQSSNVNKRIKQHKNALLNGTYQSDFLKEKVDPDYSFQAILLETIDPFHSKLFRFDREWHYAKQYGAFSENGLNSAPIPYHANNEFDTAIQKECHFLTILANEYARRLSQVDANKNSWYYEKLLRCAEENLHRRLFDLLEKVMVRNNEEKCSKKRVIVKKVSYDGNPNRFTRESTRNHAHFGRI